VVTRQRGWVCGRGRIAPGGRTGFWVAALLVVLLVPLLCSCASTTIKQTWKASDYSGGPVGKTAVLAVVERGLLRQGVENRFVKQLRQGGQPAQTTFDVFTLSEAEQDTAAAAATLREQGVESVLIITVADNMRDYNQLRAGGEKYAGVTTGVGSWGWRDYYSVAFVDMSTTYSSLRQRVVLDASLFDLRTEKRLWSAMSKTVLRENTDTLTELDNVVALIVDRLRADGMVR